MTMMASQITSLAIVYSTVYSGADQIKHQSSTSLAFVWGIHRSSNAEKVSIWWRHYVLLEPRKWQARGQWGQSRGLSYWYWIGTLQWRHSESHGVSNHRRLEYLLNRLFERRSKKTSKLRVTGRCKGNSSVTGEFSAQRASNAENVSIWWRHHGK